MNADTTDETPVKMLRRVAADARNATTVATHLNEPRDRHLTACAGALEALAALWPLVHVNGNGSAPSPLPGPDGGAVWSRQVLDLIPHDVVTIGTDDPVVAVGGLVSALKDVTQRCEDLAATNDELRRRRNDTRQALGTALGIAPGTDLAPLDLIGAVANVVAERDQLLDAPQPTPCPDPGLHRPDHERVQRWNDVLTAARVVVGVWRENRSRGRVPAAAMDRLADALDVLDRNEPEGPGT